MSKKSNSNDRIICRITPKMKQALDLVIAEQNTTVSDILRDLLENFLEKHTCPSDKVVSDKVDLEDEFPSYRNLFLI